MFLVQVHTDVASVSRALLDRTLNALVEGVADEALNCFRTVKKFGMGGMLRVRFHPFSTEINFKKKTSYSIITCY